eukprot:g2010.t1
MAGSARRMRQDRELASKLQEEDDRMFAMSMHSGFGGMKGNAKDNLKMTLLHKNFYNNFGDDYDNNDPDLVIPPKKKK